VKYVVYDNACGVVRHLNKQIRERTLSPVVLAAWQVMASLKWVIDRLHWTYHRGCRDSKSGWYVPGVDPAGHPSLLGIDTEGAEQVFHIATRWQAVLSNTSPVHQELFLLVFAWQHNKHHSCTAAIKSDIWPRRNNFMFRQYPRSLCRLMLRRTRVVFIRVGRDAKGRSWLCAPLNVRIAHMVIRAARRQQEPSCISQQPQTPKTQKP
jgi:hypothetical protein